jgi:hypothetical protein
MFKKSSRNIALPNGASLGLCYAAEKRSHSRAPETASRNETIAARSLPLSAVRETVPDQGSYPENYVGRPGERLSFA